MRIALVYKACIVLLCGLVSQAVNADPADNNIKGKIATVSPISFSLTQAMVKDTELHVSYLPPKRLPVNRVASWIRKNASNKFEHFDAFVSISAVKPGLDLFPSLRQRNIRIVDIDIAQAIVPNGEKVALAADAEFFWLNSNNLLVMAGILKRDLIALWPTQKALINQNYQDVAAAIRQINLQLDEQLMDNDIAFIIPSSSKLTPFVASLSSDTSTKEEAIELGLPYLVIDSSKKTPSEAWKIDDFSRFAKTDLIERLKGQVSSLNAIVKKQQ
ncbi:MAG: hypothetical protein MK214_10285 [Thalassotalea sp.]|nr:hypothetical protein [Thalassotalea sp.]